MAPVLIVETHFHQQDECSVFIESSAPALRSHELEVWVFCLFAARQLVNLSSSQEGQALAVTLLAVRDHQERIQAGEIGESARLVQYQGSPGRKRFGAQYFEDPLRFILKGKGFGFLSRGAGYYAPTSVLALLAFLLRRSQDEAEYLQDLLNSAGLCGAEFLRGNLRLGRDSAVAIQIAQLAHEMTQEGTEISPGG
jgi:hypothetical protein